MVAGAPLRKHCLAAGDTDVFAFYDYLLHLICRAATAGFYITSGKSYRSGQPRSSEIELFVKTTQLEQGWEIKCRAATSWFSAERPGKSKLLVHSVLVHGECPPRLLGHDTISNRID